MGTTSPFSPQQAPSRYQKTTSRYPGRLPDAHCSHINKKPSFICLPRGVFRLPAPSIQRRRQSFPGLRNYLHVGCIYWQLNGSAAPRHQSPLNMLFARLLPASNPCGLGNVVEPSGAACSGGSSWQSPPAGATALREGWEKIMR